ncbi:uncharacterized protein IL334_007163 [Kwoniella shivajii]|uniref:Uncharacterized protein n=1 Tax=Kwoniella shivajii TaxID=564305 RepID=A0ABZ1D9R8_9TREE|nr:hypothetical protein IL334_007163 [Kwoniella shivajii]
MEQHRDMEPTFIIHAHSPTAEGGSWGFHIADGGPFEMSPPEPLDTSVERFVEILSRMTSLAELDLTIRFHPGTIRPAIPAYDSNQPRTWSTYLEQQKELSVIRQDIRKYESQLESAMTSAAQILLDAILSLQTGFFWTLAETTLYTPITWCRWRWSRHIDWNGTMRAKIDPEAERFHQGWMYNTDGFTRNPERDDDFDTDDDNWAE